MFFACSRRRCQHQHHLEALDGRFLVQSFVIVSELKEIFSNPRFSERDDLSNFNWDSVKADTAYKLQISIQRFSQTEAIAS